MAGLGNKQFNQKSMAYCNNATCNYSKQLATVCTQSITTVTSTLLFLEPHRNKETLVDPNYTKTNPQPQIDPNRIKFTTTQQSYLIRIHVSRRTTEGLGGEGGGELRASELKHLLETSHRINQWDQLRIGLVGQTAQLQSSD